MRAAVGFCCFPAEGRDFEVATAFFLTGFAGVALRVAAGFRLRVEAEALALVAVALRAGAPFADPFALLPLVALPDFVALRAGALSAAERFAKGLGRADLLPNARFFAEDVEEVEREAGREEDERLTPLMIGSLMRSPRLLKKSRSK